VTPLAVIDVETTGLNPYRHDRVVEVAAVLMLPEEGIQEELVTLVNPERDVGPTSVHGLSASDLIDAPRFADIAAPLVEVLRGAAVLVGHNVRFDVSFLQSEYQRIDIEMPPYTTLDTMALAGGGTLSACCAEHGVQYDGKSHAALDDARATAFLLQKLLVRNPNLLTQWASCNPPTWPRLQTLGGRLLSRESVVRPTAAVPSYVQRLAGRLSVGSADVSHPEGERDYRALLWRVLEDGRIEEAESESLVEVATHWGLPFKRVEAIHLGYLSELAKAAWADRNITSVERREIQNAAQLLGFGRLADEQLQTLLRSCEIGVRVDTAATGGEDWTGKTVCFTGECACSIHGQIISREMAEQLAAGKGLRVIPSVIKQLDLLVVADPNTQSGKAKKARQYGIRIIHEPVFWRSLGVAVD
jgi:DNA polymerase-3 subunit epsilon